MKNIPQKIYLQLGDDGLEVSDFDKCSEVTWCEDRQDESDLEYVLAQEVPTTSGCGLIRIWKVLCWNLKWWRDEST